MKDKMNLQRKKVVLVIICFITICFVIVMYNRLSTRLPKLTAEQQAQEIKDYNAKAKAYARKNFKVSDVQIADNSYQVVPWTLDDGSTAMIEGFKIEPSKFGYEFTCRFLSIYSGVDKTKSFLPQLNTIYCDRIIVNKMMPGDKLNITLKNSILTVLAPSANWVHITDNSKAAK